MAGNGIHVGSEEALMGLSELTPDLILLHPTARQ
jgi:hypothetical protein